MDFLIAATTSGEGKEPPITVQPGAVTELTGVLDVIQDRRENLLYRHLPRLRPTLGHKSDPALLGIMTTMQAMQSASANDLDDR